MSADPGLALIGGMTGREKVRFLLSEEAARALDVWGRRGSYVARVAAVRKIVPIEAVKWVEEAADLATRAREKFGPLAASMAFDREALEEATPLEVARHRAAKLGGFGAVADLGCGLGGDLIALAERARVAGVEIDPARALLAMHNVRACVPGAEAIVVRADLRDRPVRARAAFADPSRRRAGKRVKHPSFGEPPIEEVLAAWNSLDLLAIKCSPLMAPDDVPPEAGAEWVSLRGELKECTLWFGSASRPGVCATVLPAGATIEGEPNLPLPTPVPAGEALYRIDPGAVKARIVSVLCERTGLAPIDARPAYLTGPCGVEDPFLAAFRVLERIPARDRALRSTLNRMGIGSVVLHKQNFPGSGEDVRDRLDGKLRGSRRAHVILTLERGEKAAFLVEPIAV
ncbi:MAG: hypothetical protein JXP34_26300 [Planctomycetes bacterium]|nr:hypothetical protein [Planctomycetota bacterium]